MFQGLSSSLVNGNASGDDKLSLAELQDLAKDDPRFQNLSEARKNELLAQLEEHWDVKKMGMCANNRSAAQDVCLTVQRLTKEVSSIS